MGFRSLILKASLVLICWASESRAASLQVYPVSIEVKVPTMAATLTLRNLDVRLAATQIRVFRWYQKEGKDILEPTQSVVASPPAISLKPNTDYTVRVVRVDNTPIRGEESYRLLVDQIPDLALMKTGGVNLAIRYSIPIFFSKAPQVAKLSWAILENSGHIELVGTNPGQQRVKITNLTITDSGGRVLKFGNGLLGYVLGGGSVNFNSHVVPLGYALGGPFLIKYSTDNGLTEAIVSGQSAN